MSGVLPSTLLALLAAGSLVFGSALPTLPLLRTRWFADRLSLLIGFSAGLMLATALHELLPEAMEANPDRAMWGASLGFLTLYVAERLTHFHACRHRRCDVEHELHGTGAEPDAADHHHMAMEMEDRPSSFMSEPPHMPHHAHAHGHADTMALVGMGIHNFADGLTTAAAFAVSQTVGIVVVLAIVLHQMAAGLSLGAIMLRVGRSRRRVWVSTTAVASFILWGALFYHFVVAAQAGTGAAAHSLTGIVLGIAGGSFLYVAACDLLPEAHAEDEGWGVMAMTLFGYLFALLVIMVFGHHAHEAH
jgi:zinc and cadmium transporter